jgi:hypothetical protein
MARDHGFHETRLHRALPYDVFSRRMFLIGTYTLLSMAFNAFRLDLDPGLTAEGFDPPQHHRRRAPDMPHFAKPAEGSWTQHFPELGTSPVDYSDSVDPAYYGLEKEAIFKKT